MTLFVNEQSGERKRPETASCFWGCTLTLRWQTGCVRNPEEPPSHHSQCYKITPTSHSWSSVTVSMLSNQKLNVIRKTSLGKSMMLSYLQLHSTAVCHGVGKAWKWSGPYVNCCTYQSYVRLGPQEPEYENINNLPSFCSTYFNLVFQRQLHLLVTYPEPRMENDLLTDSFALCWVPMCRRLLWFVKDTDRNIPIALGCSY